jgi:hypothetical protein
MKTLDDLAYQLFSQVLTSSRKGTPIEYDKRVFPCGEGFSLTNNDESAESFYLTDKNGLLGFHHPLLIKSRLEAAFDPRLYVDQHEREDLLSEMESFFKEALGVECFIGQPETNISQASGRFHQFLAPHDLEALRTGHKITVPYAFSFSFSLSLEKSTDCFQQPLTVTQYNYAKSLIRLFTHAHFYDDASFIDERSKNIEDCFKDLPFVKNILGLSIELEKGLLSKCHNIYGDGDTLNFPLNHSKDMINRVIKNLKESYVHR